MREEPDKDYVKAKKKEEYAEELKQSWVANVRVSDTESKEDSNVVPRMKYKLAMKSQTW